MEKVIDAIPALLSSSPTVLALLIAFAALGVVGFALYVVLRALGQAEK